VVLRCFLRLPAISVTFDSHRLSFVDWRSASLRFATVDAESASHLSLGRASLCPLERGGFLYLELHGTVSRSRPYRWLWRRWSQCRSVGNRNPRAFDMCSIQLENGVATTYRQDRRVPCMPDSNRPQETVGKCIMGHKTMIREPPMWTLVELSNQCFCLRYSDAVLRSMPGMYHCWSLHGCTRPAGHFDGAHSE